MSATTQPGRPPAQSSHYSDDGFGMLRTPLLPFDTFLAWNALARASEVQDAQSPHLDEVLVADRQRLSEFVRDAYRDPVLREALFLASPDLHDALSKAEQDGQGARTDDDRTVQALARYFSRAACRPTPFGLFAGCSLVLVADRTNLQIDGLRTYTRHSRLDMDYLSALTLHLGARREVQRAARLSANSSAHSLGGRIHYVAARYVNGYRHYSLDAVESSPAIAETLCRAAGGARLIDLAQALVDDEVTLDDAVAFIEELVEAQLLVVDIQPSITGGDAARTLLSDIAPIPELRAISGTLETTLEQLRELDGRGLGNCTSEYVACADRLQGLPVPVRRNRLFQVDLYKPAPGATLGRALAQDAARAAELLCRITSRPDPLAEFRDRFHERYEEREVPLLEALDDEIGIGLTPRPGSRLTGGTPPDTSRRRDTWLAELRLRAAERGVHSIELTAEDLTRLQPAQPNRWPDSLSVVGTVIAPSAESAETGAFRFYVQYCTGPSGARLFGRFSHLDDALRQRVEAHLRAEEARNPDALFAEVIHLPQGRVGNVISRPPLRALEIAYLGRSMAPTDRQVPVGDLTLSLTNGRLVLRSRRLGREIVPRLTTAHNYSNDASLPVYRFLGLLQEQGLVSVMSWDWGDHFSVSPFLPRVTHGRLILTPARWLISPDESRALSSAKGAARFRAVREWRSRRGIPRRALLSEGDNQLPIDFENVVSVDVFCDLVRRASAALLFEMLAADEGLSAFGPEGRFTNEVVIPLSRTAPAQPSSPPVTAAPRPEIRGRRSFVPGSQWLYAKLYVGEGLSDRLLRTVVGPFARQMVHARLVSHWFFLRYTDPDPHLRVRLCGAPAVLQREVWPRLAELLQPELDQATLARVQLDTYSRELERYGGDAGIELAERLFWADSESALDLVEALQTPMDGNGGLERLISAIAAVDVIFGALQFPIAQRRQILASMSLGPADRRKIWGEWHRRNRSALTAALTRDAPVNGDARRSQILATFDHRVRPIGEALLLVERGGGLSRPRTELVRSYAHMCINRIVSPAQVRSGAEPLCYDALGRHYQSLLARGLDKAPPDARAGPAAVADRRSLTDSGRLRGVEDVPMCDVQ
jgi:lantibiotic biosynthesis protein